MHALNRTAMAFVIGGLLVAARPAVAVSITDYTIYARGNVQIGVGTIVGTATQTALVGAGTGVAGIGDASLNGTAGIYGDLQAGDDVVLNNNTFVTGTVTNPDQYTKAASATVGSRVIAMPVFPTLPGATAFSAGLMDISVANNGTLSLAPGSYDDINVGGAVTLNLVAGSYYIDTFSAGNGLKINVDLTGGNINLYFLTSFYAGGVQYMNLSGGTWEDIYTEVKGSGTNAFQIAGGGGTNWRGTVYTTAGGINLGSGSSTGTIEGYLWSYGNVVLQHGLDVIPGLRRQVPEPGTLALLGLGLAGLGLSRRRKAH